jgi:hypothetical protein
MPMTKSGWDLLSIRPVQVTENISLHVHNGKLIERDLVSGQYKWLKISACKHITEIKKICEHSTNTCD